MQTRHLHPNLAEPEQATVARPAIRVEAVTFAEGAAVQSYNANNDGCADDDDDPNDSRTVYQVAIAEGYGAKRR